MEQDPDTALDMARVSLSGLTPGRFVARLNRFVAEVELGDRVVRAHVPSTGRMRELLFPGAMVMVRTHDRTDRRTACDLVLARRDTDEVAPEPAWVSVDARLPNRLMDGYWQAVLQKGPGDLSAVRREPRWGAGRFDFALSERGAVRMVEVKSVTLVREEVALFPDAPTQRGARHLLELADYVASGEGPASIVFVVQRSDAAEVRVNVAADPVFHDALKSAAAAGVETLAFACLVEPAGVTLDRPLPVRVNW